MPKPLYHSVGTTNVQELCLQTFPEKADLQGMADKIKVMVKVTLSLQAKMPEGFLQIGLVSLWSEDGCSALCGLYFTR